MINGHSVYINMLLSLLSQRVTVPTEFHDRAGKIRTMLDCDTSGLVDSLSQFQVDCATVDVKIETENENLNILLNDKWLKKLNRKYRGYGIERGLRGLQREYLKERWRGASFPVLKVTKWEKIDGMNLPTGLIFVEGGDIYAKSKAKKKGADLVNFDYYLGKDESDKLDPAGGACFIYKPFSRWYAKYPSPFMIARGIYKNWKIIDIIKDKELQLVEQVIPYLLWLIKGDKDLELSDDPVTYDDDDLKAVVNKVDELLEKLKTGEKKVPTKATNWDEDIKHLIPDMEAMFKRELFLSAERNILAGFGFIDIVEAVSTSRRESLLNPKAFIKEVNSGIDGFKVVVEDLVELVKEKNPGMTKYTAKEWNIESKPVTEFVTKDIVESFRYLRDRGDLSEETFTAVVGHGMVDYNAENVKLKKEQTEGFKRTHKPKANQVQDLKIQAEIDGTLPASNNNPAPDNPDKTTPDKQGAEKKNYNFAKLQLRGAPYVNVKELPAYVQKMSIKQQRKWMRIFNHAWNFYTKKKLPKKRVEQIAFMTANDRVKGGDK